MAKISNNIFPKLRGMMAEYRDTIPDLANLLKISDDTLRRTLKGERDFELSEMKLISQRYKTTMDDLFIFEPSQSTIQPGVIENAKI